MKNIYIYIISTIVLLLSTNGCSTFDYDLQENPNYLSTESSDPTYLLNEVQYLFYNILEDMSLNTDDVMRYEALTTTYSDEISSTVLNVEWERFYEALTLSRVIVDMADKDETLLFHKAVSKLLMGYLTVTMVDYTGALPYSQAGYTDEYPNPELDEGTELYKMVLDDIDQAIIDIDSAGFDLESDLFYDSDKTKWIRFANSLKFKMLVQTRLASSEIGISDLKSELNALLVSDLIDDVSDDFQYHHTSVIEPESRHFYYREAYVSQITLYLGNHFMNELRYGKSIADPRIRYYIYRQSDADPFANEDFPDLPCENDTGIMICYVGDHYIGYDQGQTLTGRGENLRRSVYGMYPGGGTFDEDQFIEAPSTSGLDGAGIIPIITSSYISFLAAEAVLTIGVDGNAAEFLEHAIRESMTKVMSFSEVSSDKVPTDTDVEYYITEVMTNYSNAANDEEKLDIVISEFYLASFGYSIEAYNAYRRTGYPSNIQSPVNNANPVFPRSFPYAKEEVEYNTSIDQKLNTEQVFWDTNPAGFID